MEARTKSLGYHEKRRLLELRDRCFVKDSRTLSSNKVQVFDKAVKEYSLMGFNTLQYDMIVSNYYQRLHLQKFKQGDGTAQ